jgi:proteasome accessory factor C
MNNNSIRLARLLTMLPWLTQQKNVSATEISRIFAISEKEVFSDLALLTFVGPDQAGGGLVDIQYTKDQVRVIDPQGLDTPLTLSDYEILTLLMGLKTLQELEVDNPATTTAIEKLARLMSEDNTRSAMNLVINSAIESNQLLKISYLSQDRGTVTERKIEPLSISAESSTLYLKAWCQKSDGFRKFRIDRVLSAEPLNDTFAYREWPQEITENLQHISLTFDVAARWVLEQYQVQPTSIDSKEIRVVLDVHSLSWLIQFLTASAFWIQKISLDQEVKSALVETISSCIARLK